MFKPCTTWFYFCNVDRYINVFLGKCMQGNIHSHIYAPNCGFIQSSEREGYSCPDRSRSTDQDRKLDALHVYYFFVIHEYVWLDQDLWSYSRVNIEFDACTHLMPHGLHRILCTIKILILCLFLFQESCSRPAISFHFQGVHHILYY